MYTKLRAEINGDFSENYVSITEHKTKLNQSEINCGECNKTFYADREEFEKISRAIEQGLDNPFRCDDCRTASEEEMARER